MNKRKFINASGWYLFSSFFLRGIGLITTPFFTRILSKSEFGLLENFNALLSIMLIIGSLCFSATLARAKYDHAGKEYEYIKTCMLFTSLLVFVFCLVFLAFKNSIESFMQLDDRYFVIMFLVLLFNPALELYSNLAKLNYNYKSLSAVNISVGVLGVLLSFGLIALLDDNLLARVLGAQFPIVLFGLFFYVTYCIKGKSANIDFIKYAIPICIPLVIHSISGAILNSSDRMMITRMCGVEYNAFYSIACSCSQLVYIFWFSMNSAFVPLLAEKMNEKKYNEIHSFSVYYIVIFAFVVLGLLFIAPDVVLLLGGKQYLEASYSVPAIMVSFAFLFLYSLYVNVEQFMKITKGMAAATTCCALVNVLFNLVFIPLYGYIAAAYTTMAGYFLMLLFHYAIIKKHDLQEIYNNKLIFGISFLGLLFSLVFPILYSYSALRYVLLSIYVVFLLILFVKHKNLIMSLIKKDDSKN